VAHTIVVAAEGANPRVIILVDDQQLPDAGTARLRFLPLDAAAGPLDLAVAGGPILAVGVAPFTVGPSVAVPARTAGLDVRAPGRPERCPPSHRRAARREPDLRGVAGCPYLGFLLRLDPGLVASVMVETGHAVGRGQAAVPAIDVSPLGADLLDAVVRLARLADAPGEARFLAPLITREIVYLAPPGRAGRPARPDHALWAARPTGSLRPRAAPARLRQAAADRGHRPRAGDERLGFHHLCGRKVHPAGKPVGVAAGAPLDHEDLRQQKALGDNCSIR
jgi:hypothetical protein